MGEWDGNGKEEWSVTVSYLDWRLWKLENINRKCAWSTTDDGWKLDKLYCYPFVLRTQTFKTSYFEPNNSMKSLYNKIMSKFVSGHICSVLYASIHIFWGAFFLKL